MKQYKGYLVDLDGTTYKGKERIPEAELFICELINRGIPFKIVTNNATKSVEEITDNLNNYYNIPVEQSHIYTSIIAMGDYLLEHHEGENIFVVGEKALIDYLKKIGFTINSDEKIDVVVQGLDREVEYNKLTTAVRAILNGAEYLVTNTDRLIPTENGFIPSSGAITSFIEFATRTKPTVMGKPNQPIMQGAIERLGLDHSEVLMIGDNYDTDILAGINLGIDTLLVLTGITRREDIKHITKQPSYIVDSLSDWMEKL
ncbi:TIGR01457 family HAD-type hydrolase [Aerococcaceae bacterium WGS1372]